MTKNWLAELPPIDSTPHTATWDEFLRYGCNFLDVERDGFNGTLKKIGELPFRKSIDVKSSPLGLGFELLDHRTAYDFDKVLPIVRDSGIKWARLQSGWQRAEQVEGIYDFAWLDHIVDGLLSAGIQPWFSLSFGNGIYMNAEPIGPHRNYLFSPTVFGERAVRGWENYCRAMTEHFKTRVFHWEVWNEPNAGFLRKPGLGAKIEPEEPEVYAQLVAVTEKAIHAVQPEGKIIGGAISGGEIRNEYIKVLFDSGIAKHIDIFSYHPYGAIPELNWPERLQYIRDLIAASGRDIKIWQGENGRPSAWNLTRKAWKYTEGNQAKFLARRYLTDLRLGLDMTSYFLACDLGNGYNPEGKVYSQGVIDANDDSHYKPKLAFRTVQSFAALFDSEVKPLHINLEVQPSPSGWSQTTRPLDDLYPLTTGFQKYGCPIFAYYHPTNPDSDYDLRHVSLNIYPPDGLVFEHPVLIDPVTGNVFAMTHWFRSNGNGQLILADSMPLADYPLFITDESLLEKIQK